MLKLIFENLSALLQKRKTVWILWTVVLILNFMAYVQDPIRFSEGKCLGFPCKWTAYFLGINVFLLDILTFLSLWLTIPFTTNLPDFWFIPLIAVGIGYISQVTVNSKTYNDKDNFEPPPKYLWPKSYRVGLYTAILIINILIFMYFFLTSFNMTSTMIKNGGATAFERFVVNRFGGYSKNRVDYIMGWIGIIGSIFDGIALYYCSSFRACDDGLPKSWDF